MEKVTYKYLAERDLKAAEALFMSGNFTNVVIMCQQVVEKYFKEYISVNGSTEDKLLLKTHALLELYDKVVELGGLRLDNEVKNICTLLLKNYHHLDYPNAYYHELSKEEAEDTLNFAKAITAQINLMGNKSDVFGGEVFDKGKDKYGEGITFSRITPDNIEKIAEYIDREGHMKSLCCEYFTNMHDIHTLFLYPSDGGADIIVRTGDVLMIRNKRFKVCSETEFEEILQEENYF